MTHYLVAQILNIILLQPQSVVLLILIPILQMDDQIADGTPFDMPEALVYAVQAISAGSSFHFSAPELNSVPST